ncbi:MAG: PrgI family protein [Clostridia bacterium]|nr:PrgI family protein [Clostridia bacterium]
MGTYEIPRNVKGEGRILFIFSVKSLLWTAATGAVGLLFFFIFNILNLNVVGIIIALVFAAIGYVIGSFKVPEISSWEFTRKTGGENIDDVIKRAINFRRKGRRIYVYTKEEKE